MEKSVRGNGSASGVTSAGVNGPQNWTRKTTNSWKTTRSRYGCSVPPAC